MSTQKFNARGVRNGFPRKPLTQNVDTLPWWTTLSGVNANNYTSFSSSALAAKIAESHQMAADLFYRIKTVYGTANASDTSGSGNSVSLNSSYLVGHTVNNLDVVPSEPYERVAAGDSNPANFGMDLETDSYIATSSPTARVGWGRFGEIGSVTKMYLAGDLIGYSFSSNASLTGSQWPGISLQAFTGFSRCAVLHTSGASSQIEAEAASNPNFEAEINYVTEQGHNFVGVVWAQGTTSRSVSLAGKTASALSVLGSGTSSADATFNSFDFYDTFT